MESLWLGESWLAHCPPVGTFYPWGRQVARKDRVRSRIRSAAGSRKVVPPPPLCLEQSIPEGRAPVLKSIPHAHRDHAALEVHAPHVQPDRIHQARTPSAEHRYAQYEWALPETQQSPHVVRAGGQRHPGQTLRPVHPLRPERIELWQVTAHKQDHPRRLNVRGRRKVAFDCKISNGRGNLVKEAAEQFRNKTRNRQATSTSGCNRVHLCC